MLMTNPPLRRLAPGFLLLLVCSTVSQTLAQESVQAELISVEKIWDEAPHNAFTDLVRWKNRFYCAFREGQGHAGDQGKLRIIVSEDGQHWQSAALLEDETFDLRDAAISIRPDGRMMVMGGAQKQIEGQRRTGTFVSFSADGVEFSAPQIVVEPGRWLWRVTEHGDAAYGVSYGAPIRQQATALLKTTNGVDYEVITDSMLDDGERPTEARIRFGSDDTAYCLQRRDGSTLNTAMLGVSKPPYTQWKWHDLKQRLGGPNLIQIPSGRWLAAGRLYDGGARTELLSLDVDTFEMKPILRLPSGGDTSYPGMVWHNNLLWLSYYASHEGKTSIYLAKIKIQDVKAPQADMDSSDARALSDNIRRLGDRRELFVDHYLIDQANGVELQLHPPVAREKVLTFDAPWEGAFCGYITVLKDGETFRMYYRGLPQAGADGSDREVTCYAESRDGIHWIKPGLDLFESDPNQPNNIVLQGETPCSHNFSPFLDGNPKATAGARFKALGGTASSGLIAFQSEDGIHWSRMQAEPVIQSGAFDSQNVAFWSPSEQLYVCYFRTFAKTDRGSFRSVSRTTSKDFLHWSEPVAMSYGDTPFEHLYTNQTHPYFYAPHLSIGVAARFWPGRRVLSAEQAADLQVNPKYFGDISDAVLLTTRGGSTYQRTFMESYIRPGIGLENWVSRTNYPALGIIPTSETELSVYVQKNYGQPNSFLQRYSLRTDGFSSVHANYRGGEFTTPVLTFGEHQNADRCQLILNMSTSAAGFIRVEVQDAEGKPIKSLNLAHADELIGDQIDRAVTWKGQSDLSAWMGKPVRLRFIMKDADLYSIRFDTSTLDHDPSEPE
jgi:hypothetical protein